MTVFRAATLRTFFFAFHAGAKELKLGFSNVGPDHNNLMFCCNARWFSKDKVLLGVYKLKNIIFIFLKEENHALATTFGDEVFLTQLAYFCDFLQY